ncbi:MAG: hypothetical protein V1747_07370 [Candidatus Omnitrophota bacterium]
MNTQSRAIERIETNMESIEVGSLRYSILACAKNFKSSWLELGQHLVSVYNDKLYKGWGYLTFEAYCSKEIGIRKQTGFKLLRSYHFLEQEEPQYIKKEYIDSANGRNIPSFEAVHTLSQVKANKDLGSDDYAKMKRHIFEEGKPDKEVKDVYQSMIKQVKESSPEEEHKLRRFKYLRRVVGSLNSIRKEIKLSKFLSEDILKELDLIITKIEVEIG